MKIILIRPNFGSYYQITPPLSLGYLSASLKNAGYKDIALLDASLEKLNPQEGVNVIESMGDFPNIVGIQVYTGAQNWTKEFAGILRKYSKQIKVVVGGPHVTALKERALDYMGINFGIIGEGEEPIVKFAKYINNEISADEVCGLIYKSGRGWKKAEKPFGFIKDPDKIPIPDWELLQPQRYFRYMASVSMPLRGNRPAPIITSRGCPYQCTFCCSGATGRHIMRYRSAENIVEEISCLKEKYGVNEIFFSDDNLTMDSQRAEKIFDLMIEKKLNVFWRAPNGIRVDSLNESLVNKMAKSGGYYVGLGIETGNEQMIKKIKKKVDLKKVKVSVDLLHKYGIKVSGFFMAGLIGETKKQINDSINFAVSIPFDRIQVCNFVPYPGSEDFDVIYKKTNKAKYSKNLLKFQKNGFVPSFSSMALKEIYEMQRKFLLKFYLRPKILLQLLLEFKWSQVTALFKHPFIKKWLSFSKEWYDY